MEFPGRNWADQGPQGNRTEIHSPETTHHEVLANLAYGNSFVTDRCLVGYRDVKECKAYFDGLTCTAVRADWSSRRLPVGMV